MHLCCAYDLDTLALLMPGGRQNPLFPPTSSAPPRATPDACPCSCMPTNATIRCQQFDPSPLDMPPSCSQEWDGGDGTLALRRARILDLQDDCELLQAGDGALEALLGTLRLPV